MEAPLALTGGFTGAGNLFLQSNATIAGTGDSPITLSGGTIDNQGLITNNGAGSGGTNARNVDAIINATIGTNVQGVVENSAHSALQLNAANLYAGDTTDTLGTIKLGNVNALQGSTLNMDGGAVAFTVAGTNTYNLGGLKGSSGIALGGNSLSVGANDSTTSYSGQITGAGSLTKTGGGALTLSNSTGNGYTSGTTVVAGRPVHLQCRQLQLGHRQRCAECEGGRDLRRRRHGHRHAVRR